jgi:hypothetical protein
MAISVTTQHNDNNRSGANLQETILRTNNVNVKSFGKQFELTVDGHVYAQPLYLPGVNVAGVGPLNVLYVATMHNSVYAFDADNTSGPRPLWRRSMGPSVALPDPNIGGGVNYRDIQIEIGIVSTPVISLDQQAIYVVAATKESGNYFHRLHALDLRSGAEMFGGPRMIAATVLGTGAGSSGGTIRFQSNLQNQRPALLLSAGTIYVAFASYGDIGDYHGWVLGYDSATLQPLPNAANLTVNTLAGGIWQAGQGPSADAQGNVYVVSGNADYNERSIAGKVTLVETAIGSPAVANIDDRQLALAWTGNEALRRLNLAVSVDGRQFTGKMTLTDTSLEGPALTFGNGRLFLGWTGPDVGTHVNVSSSADFQTFQNKVVLNESSPFGPALASANGRIFLAWTGREALQRLNVMSSTDGVTWQNKITLNEQSAAAPALAFINGKLYLSWAGTDVNRSLNVIESVDGVTFANKHTFPNRSNFAQAFANDGAFQMMWAGMDRNQALRLMSGPAPGNVGNQQTYSDTAAAGPALVRFKGALLVLWTGNEALRRLNVATVSDVVSLGDCFVKLGPDLEILDWFTPFNTLALNDTDGDLGSGGILLLPETQLMTGGGKEGILYLIDRNHLGRFCSTCDATTGETHIVQSFQATAKRFDPTAPEPAMEAAGYHHIHGSPVFWDSPNRGPVVYVWGEADQLRAFAFNGTRLSANPVDISLRSVVTPARSMPGAMLSLSANGSAAGTGILWASHPTNEDANQGVVPGTLRAMDASNLQNELWNSGQAPRGRDLLGNIAKFNPPTVANGRVYAATFSNKVVVYGPLA